MNFNYQLEYRNILSLTERECFKVKSIIGVFACARDVRTIKEYSKGKINVWTDNRRPENSIEIYFNIDNGWDLFKKRCDEQNEFDKSVGMG